MKKAKILSKEFATHDVVHLKLEKPSGIIYKPGQAVDIALSKPEWENELRAFTFTSLPSKDYLEFFIKTYPERKSVTAQIRELKPGDELLVGDVFGDINYKGEGIFIAGGAGITPFIAILRHLQSQNKIGGNKLIFANKTKADIIEHDYFKELLGNNFINVLSEEEHDGYEHGFITKRLIENHLFDNSYIYLCGPPPMMDAIAEHLILLEVDEDRIIREQF